MADKKIIYQLQNYHNKVKKWKKLTKNKRYDLEENTIIKFVLPLLEILGWDRLSEDMEFEYPVDKKDGRRLGFVDIALSLKNSKKPVIFVEVKRIQGKLGTGRQLLRYLHAKKVKYGIYTDGKEWRFLDNRTPVKYMPEGLFIMKVEDFIKYRKVLSVFSKRSVETGKLDRLTNRFHDKKFWKFVEKEEKNVKRSERKNLKYNLRLKYAAKQLNYF